MAVSLSDFSSHFLLHPLIHPKRSDFLCPASKSSSHSNQSNLSLKPSSSKTPSHSPNTSRSKKLLRKSLVESIVSQGHKLDIRSRSYLVKCLCRSGELDQATRVISLLESQSHGQSETDKTILYNAFIGGLVLHFKQTIFALETVGRMRANGCQPDTRTCSLLVRGLCHQGLLDLAFEIVEHFKTCYKVSPSLKAYNQLLEGTIVRKGPKEGLKLLDEMESEGFLPDETTYNSVLRAVCTRGSLDEIQAILDGISTCGFELDFAAFCALVRVSLENKHFAKVDKVIDEMLVKANNEQLYGMVSMLCEEGLVDKARALIEWLLKNRRIKLNLCNPVIDIFIKEGHPNKATDFIHKIVSVYGISTISCYNTILSGLCKRGHVLYALEVLDDLEKMGYSPDLVTYNILIGPLWSIGDHLGSVKMVSQLLKKGFTLDDVTYSTLITCLCQDGMVDEANEIKRIMVENGFMVTKPVYDMFLAGFCKVGRVNEAIDLLDEMLESDCEVNCGSVGKILEGLAHIGYEYEARKIGEELVFTNLIWPVKLLYHSLG
ncbi:hypothetical protein LUZ60_000862 [Juncus effusus]|nr:hypothetical protein LUZ60_000862 [Juncus effusus]